MCNGGSYYVAKILLLLMLLAGRFAVSFICTQYTRAQGASSSIHNIVGPGGLLLIYCTVYWHLGPPLLIHRVGPGGLFLIYFTGGLLSSYIKWAQGHTPSDIE
jgi:glutamine amidotransferase-like uncharacterized protein